LAQHFVMGTIAVPHPGRRHSV